MAQEECILEDGRTGPDGGRPLAYCGEVLLVIIGFLGEPRNRTFPRFGCSRSRFARSLSLQAKRPTVMQVNLCAPMDQSTQNELARSEKTHTCTKCWTHSCRSYWWPALRSADIKHGRQRGLETRKLRFKDSMRLRTRLRRQHIGGGLWRVVVSQFRGLATLPAHDDSMSDIGAVNYWDRTVICARSTADQSERVIVLQWGAFTRYT